MHDAVPAAHAEVPCTASRSTCMDPPGTLTAGRCQQISQDQLVGRYSTLFNTTFLLGPDKRTTLGTLTFRQFNPVDLQVSSTKTYRYVLMNSARAR